MPKRRGSQLNAARTKRRADQARRGNESDEQTSQRRASNSESQRVRLGQETDAQRNERLAVYTANDAARVSTKTLNKEFIDSYNMLLPNEQATKMLLLSNVKKG